MMGRTFAWVRAAGGYCRLVEGMAVRVAVRIAVLPSKVRLSTGAALGLPGSSRAPSALSATRVCLLRASRSCCAANAMMPTLRVVSL